MADLTKKNRDLRDEIDFLRHHADKAVTDLHMPPSHHHHVFIIILSSSSSLHHHCSHHLLTVVIIITFASSLVKNIYGFYWFKNFNNSISLSEKIFLLFIAIFRNLLFQERHEETIGNLKKKLGEFHYFISSYQ